MVYFLDSNIFLRSIIPDEIKMHQQTNAFLLHVRNHHLKHVTSTVIIAEIAWTLKSHYHKNRLEIAQILNSIQNLPDFNIVDDYQHSLAFKIFFGSNLKFIDCLIASSKNLQSGKWQLVSYDRDFDKIKGLKRLEPKDLI